MDKKRSFKLLDKEEITYTTHIPLFSRRDKLVGIIIGSFFLPLWILLWDMGNRLGPLPSEFIWLIVFILLTFQIFFLVFMPLTMVFQDLLSGGRYYYITTQRIIREVVREKARNIWPTKYLFLNELDYILFLKDSHQMRFFSIRYPKGRSFSGNEHSIILNRIMNKYTFYITASGKNKRRLIELKNNLKIVLPSLRCHSNLENLLFVPKG